MNSKPANQNVSLHSKLHTWQQICLTIIGLGILLALSIQPAQAADPIFAQQAKLTTNGSDCCEGLGLRIATYGDWVVIGQPGKFVGPNVAQGATYVYLRTGNTWTLMQILTASDGGQADYFGTSVALNQNFLIVGAYKKDAGSNGLDMGAAYVFTRSGNYWQEQQKLTPNDGQADFRFGTSVAINSNTIFVGAPNATAPTAGTGGAVYTFTLSGISGTWFQQQKLTAFDASSQWKFGSKLAVSGSSLAVSTNDFPDQQSTPKAVYLFTQSGGIWFFQQKLTSPSTLPPILTYGTYGYHISISGNTLAVSGEFGMHAGPTGGTVYVYVFSGTSWVLQQSIKSPDEFSDTFGDSLALDGNRLVIGMRDDLVLSAGSRGSAYVYERTGTVWNFRQKLIAADGAAQDYFGLGMALSGNTIIVGSTGADISGYVNQGAAYVFTLQYGNTLPTLTPYGPYSIQAGSTIHNLPIAALADIETPAYSLLFDYDNTPFLTFSNVQKTGGYVSASITCDCGTYTGDAKAELNVIDGSSAVGVSTITITKTANTAPSIGRYPVTSITAGGSKTVYPQVAPSDNGTFTISASVSPGGFTGNISINQTTGAITFSNVGPVGSYTVTVTITDNCNATTTRTFPLSVL